MPRFFLEAYPWDLLGKDLGATLERLRGEVGVTGLSIWVGSPQVMQLRVRRLDPRVFRTGGGLHYRPVDAGFEAIPFRPVVSDWVDGEDRLDLAVRTCVQHGLALRGRLSAGACGQLAQRYPDLACRNAFEVDSHLGVCLVNPNAQAYLLAVLAGLAVRFPFEAVILADFAATWHEAFAGGLATAVPLGPAARNLLALCFCESCRRLAGDAGVDAEETRSGVRRILERTSSEGVQPHESFEGLLAERPALAEYRSFQLDRLNTLARRLTESCRLEVLLDRRLDGAGEGDLNGIDTSIPAGIISRIDDPGQLESAAVPRARRNELRVAASLAIGPRSPELVSMLSKAATLGFRGIEIDNFGLLPDAALTSIKQAIRFARRTAGDE